MLNLNPIGFLEYLQALPRYTEKTFYYFLQCFVSEMCFFEFLRRKKMSQIFYAR